MTEQEKLVSTNGFRANARRILIIFEHFLLWLHLLGLGVIMLIHIFIPTKLFFLMVGAYHYVERDYCFFSDNMTDETGVYGPMLAILKEDVFWVFQSYIPLLIPVVVIGHYLKREKKQRALWWLSPHFASKV